MLVAAFVVMQFIISAKAGLVNAVEGTANVRLQQQIAAGSPIQTGSTGRVEILLNPASFLWLGENSEAVLESVELTDIVVRIVSGSAIIESAAVERAGPIHVKSGALSVSITAPGTYRFSENSAFVVNGELRREDSGRSVYKGWQIKASLGDQGPVYEEARIQPADQVTPLDQWSQQRSQQIAAANSRSSDTDSALNSQTPTSPGSFLYPFGYTGAIRPHSFGFSIVPNITPFSFFQWYNGGYSFLQPLVPRPPLGIYPGFYFGRPPFYAGHPRPIARPSPSLPRPPVTSPIVPGTRPVPSRPGAGNSRGRR
jgi:hypothetical protein